MTLDRTFALELLESMALIRAVEESLVAPILDRTIRCPVHLCSGQEAVAVGVAAAAAPGDLVFGNHRSHGHYLARGGDLDALVAEVYCRESGCARGRGGSMHVVAPEQGMLGAAPIVAGTISLALGAALASRIRGDGRVAVSFFGDGAAGEGALAESLNAAALWHLPLLLVCENNLYSTHLPIRECRARQPLLDTARSLGVTAEAVDGNDVLAVHALAGRALAACRAGQGPWFIEAMTYRLRGHVGPDDNVQGTHTDIRPPAEIAAWRERDPLRVLERRLRAEHPDVDAALAAIHERVRRRVDAAHARALASPFPSPSELTRHVLHD